MNRNFIFHLAVLFILILNGCSPRINRNSISLQNPIENKTLKEIPAKSHVTIMIHGTLPLPNGIALIRPLYKALSRYMGTPLGLKHCDELGDHAFADLADILSQKDPELFDKKYFYFFGWPGALSASGRINSAHDLYNAILALKLSADTFITIIGHSHGGNLALTLADVIIEKKDKTLVIDRLILLACPVQDRTEHQIQSPLFKRVYNIFSPADIVQVMDPQGIQIKRHQKIKSFFSRRYFDPHGNLLQAEVHGKPRSPGHLDFIKPTFFKILPTIINTLDDEKLRKQLPLSRREIPYFSLKNL